MRTIHSRRVISGILLVQVLLTHAALAQSIAVEAGENNINLAYQNAGVDVESSALKMEAQVLYTEQNNHQDLFASVGLAAFTGDNRGLRPGISIRLIAADPLDYYLSAIAPGVTLNYRPTVPGLRLETSLHYAGENLTFSQAKSVFILTANLDYEISGDLLIRFGYRNIKTEQTNGISVDFDRGAYAGLLWSF